MDLNLIGKTAVVCGSTQGIGLACANELASLGARIVVVARNEEKLKSVCANLEKVNAAGHSYIVADFSRPQELSDAVAIWAKDNRANILINNTGGPPGGQAIDAEVEEFRIAFNNHLVCNHIMAKALVPGMKEEGYGRIVNIISTSVKQPLANLGVSNTVRGAVASWAKTLANELGQFNITVNNVLPGATDTVRLKSIIENKAEKTGGDFDAIQQQMANASPMKRIAKAEEVANAVAFLASPAASYINGINVPVDGGRTGSL
ncbi:MAG: 3-oxoacyl-[acyl-carrier protein] reductase [Flavobacteriales bacterium]|jgi:3-oxoacyl-[acyl-carrier protein] reductase